MSTEPNGKPANGQGTRKSDRTKAAILEVAREQFAAGGYERTTVRAIAAGAGVDPGLVIRYFGSKESLFARATRLDLKLPDLEGVDATRLGETLVRHFLSMWEGPTSGDALIILLRTAATSEEAADKMRAMFAGQVMAMLGEVSDKATLARRAGLISSQLLGLALCRYVLAFPPVVAMKPETIVADVGPTIQRYIEAPL